MLQEPLPTPLLCQDEVQFRKVWERVMSGKSSPIVIGSEKITCEKEICSPITEFSVSTSQAVPTAPPNPTKPQKPTSTKPNNQGYTPLLSKEEESTKVLCFGEESTKNLLESSITATLDALEDLKKLEKQLPQKLKPEVFTLHTNRKKQLCQLETAYFLLTGIDFLTNHPHTTEYIHPTPVPADKRLRHRFREAQIWQAIYQKAAFNSHDSCLTSLFLSLECAMKEEVTMLHSLVEAVFCLRNK